MNIKKALLVTLSTGLIAITLLQTNYVNATTENELIEENEEIESSGTSKATVEFEASTEPVDPLNPENPDEDFIHNEDIDFITGEAGPLSLNYISLIDFGNPEINVEDYSYNAETEFPNVQVSDHRGYGYGWHVTAKLSEFTDDPTTDTGEPTLPGASITLSEGRAVSKETNTSKEPEVEDLIKLEAGNPEQLIARSYEKKKSDENSQGLGDWVIRWISSSIFEDKNNENVTLSVPAGAATVGTHTADIEWILYDGPGSGDIQED